MSAALVVVIDIVLTWGPKVGPLLVKVFQGIAKAIKGGKMSKEEVLERLSPFLEGEHKQALEDILSDPEIEAERNRLGGILG